jgi:hypothetical protein
MEKMNEQSRSFASGKYCMEVREGIRGEWAACGAELDVKQVLVMVYYQISPEYAAGEVDICEE